MNKLLIYGAGGHSKVVIDAVEKQKKYSIMGILDDKKELHGKIHCRYPIIGGFDTLEKKKLRDSRIIIAITYGKIVCKLYVKIKSLGYDFGMVIHPSAIIARDVCIQPGTVILANAVVNSNTQIGKCVIINSGAIVEHDCEINDFVHIAPGAHLAGGVKVGKTAMVGIGATVIEFVRIGKNTIIGAGTVVINDIPDNVTAVGVPSKIIKKVENPNN